MGVTDFLLFSIAVFRITAIIVYEDGPFSVFSSFRDRVATYTNPLFVTVSQGVRCVWCTSVWVAAGLLLLYHFYEQAAFAVALVMALSAVGSLLDGARHRYL